MKVESALEITRKEIKWERSRRTHRKERRKKETWRMNKEMGKRQKEKVERKI